VVDVQTAAKLRYRNIERGYAARLNALGCFKYKSNRLCQGGSVHRLAGPWYAPGIVEYRRESHVC